jgi:hypothetical protein
MAAEEDPIQVEFAAVQERWREAIDAHRMAPPDGGFSARLAELAAVCYAEANICRRADAAGFDWPPHKSAGAQPYELQPDTGRRGPEALWRRFDAAVGELTRVAAGTNLVAVADAHELVADAAAELAQTVEREDRASGLLPQARRSA